MSGKTFIASRGSRQRLGRWVGLGAALLLISTSVAPAEADPCGMVPPIYTGPGQPIERVGTQKTYVFYRRGVESIAIRPGFRGKVDQFGMLIPFPSVPELRKLPDNIFPHVKAAIDPPEVVMYVYRRRHWGRKYAPRKRSKAASAKVAGGLRYDQVKVLKQEAVGMYEVAVLAAGSAMALKRWMDQHSYKYPKGMDQPCNDYVKLGWCFVAVKTRVGQKKGVDPRPGLRRVRSKLPKGSTFNGSVQAMGFRFRTKKLVVPMRLSAFNAGRLRNIVYILADGPRRIEQIPKKYVMRQIRGRELYRHLKGPLPLRVIGGTIKQLRPYQRNSLKRRRDPKPFTKHAATLFASDLLAVRRRRLSHPFEEQKKALLAIGERLGLRGAQVDRLNRQVLAKAEGKAVKTALRDVKQMTLTVVDGDFRRDVVAKDNLTFAYYRMPKDRNNRKRYDARREGPGYVNNRGILYRGALDALPNGAAAGAKARAAGLPLAALSGGAGALVLVLFGLGWIVFRRVGRRRGRGSGLLSLALLVGLSAASATAGAATVKDLIKQLGSSKRAMQKAALAQLISQGKTAVRPLMNEAYDGDNAVRRGWALVALGEIGDRSIEKDLMRLYDNPNHPLLVRTWAAAVRVKLAKTSKELLALAALSSRFPALNRPLSKRLVKAFANRKGPQAAEQMIAATARLYQLRRVLAPAIIALGAKPLVKVLVSSKNQQVRRYAASYLGNIGLKDYAGVAKRVIRAYRFRPRAQQVPWHGGPLFVPGLRWKRAEARKLVDALVRWHLWADVQGKPQLKKPIHNNLRSLSLARIAGYRSPGWRMVDTERWLQIWGKAIGRAKLRSLLLQQGWSTYRKYKKVLEQL
jgi:hypothetical protein